ncbi:DUF7680 family protein [Pleurocapsa sp. FMAR1]|uniref:DUF7680 family protein n=1 Tax=Pleurocapsa sp. FMAR1 TaxID=3040204 RepID=UPI0029C6E761|nr:hypothetical protein [Pleurocapsa sp. FMAR1]
MQEFQLRVVTTDNNSFLLELYQCAYKKAGEKKRPAAEKIGCLKGSTLNVVKQSIYQILKANDYDPKSLSAKRQSPYILTEELGVQTAILFQTVSPLSQPDRIIKIAQGISAMSNEEAHYWFAMIANGRRKNALKALRILFGD